MFCEQISGNPSQSGSVGFRLDQDKHLDVTGLFPLDFEGAREENSVSYALVPETTGPTRPDNPH